MRVIVTGSRRWREMPTVWGTLSMVQGLLYFADEELQLVHGNCPTGADAMVEGWIEHETEFGRHTLPAIHFDAEWDRYGKAAGPIRNTAMVDAGADLALAFPLSSGRGTQDCMDKLKAAGIFTLTLKERFHAA